MAQSVTKQIDKQINNPLKTSYIGNAEFKDYSKLQEQELKKIRIQQVRQQEAEKSRKNLKTKKELEEQQKHEEYLNQQFLIYQQKLQLQQKLLEEAEKQKKEIGESHRQALEAEKQRLKDLEDKQLREEQFQKNQKIRTQQAADWAKKEQEKLDYKKSFNKQRAEILEEIQEKERQEAQNYQNYIKNLPEPVQEDPLQYDAYEKQDNKKSYYNNIDFTKTYFHNPVVIKHEDDNLIENALENAKKEYEKTQIKNLELLQTKKIRKQEEEERGRAAIKMTQNERVLREFSQEMDKKKAELEQDRIKQTVNNPNHSEKPVTHFQKDIQKKALVQKAFENQFFGERAEWTHEEINDKERDIHAKKQTTQSTTLKKSQSLQNVDPKEFEKRAVENAQKKSKNVKIFTKPPLDTNVFQEKSKNKRNSQNSQEQKEDSQDKQQQEKNKTEESQKYLQQSASKSSSISNNLARSISDQNKEQVDPNILTQSQNQDNKFRNSYDSYHMSDRKVSSVTSDRKKKIRFVSPEKSNSDSDFTEEENTFGQRSGSKDNNLRHNNFVNKQNDQKNTFSPYNSNGFCEKDQQSLKNQSHQKSLQFNKSGSNFNNTGVYSNNQSSQKEQSLNRNDIKQYILEQEQYLKKLEDTRKNSRERIRQEENALLNTLNQATTTMDNKNRQNDFIQQQQQQAKNFNLSSVSIPEKKAIFIEENSSHNSSQVISHSQNHYNNNNNQYNNSNGQKRQVVYSSNPEKTKKANQMLDQFLNSNSIQNQSYNNYDSFNQRSLNEDYDERENLDYVEDKIQSSFKQTYKKENQMSQGQNSSNKINPFIKPDNFLGSSGYESQSRDFTDSKNVFADSINDASNSKSIRNDARNNHYESDFTESQLTASINNNNNSNYNESSINQQQINSSIKNSFKNQENLLATFSPPKEISKQDQYKNYEDEEEKDCKFGNTTESKYKNDSFKKYSGLGNNSNLQNNPSNISESRKLGLSQSKGPNNNSKDLIELTDSLLTSNNFNSMNKNSSSHLRQNNFNSSQNFQNHSSEHYNKRSELSPSSELSYSLSEIDKSADKFRRVEYIPQNSTTQKRNLSNENYYAENNQDSQSRIGTAKFGQPLINQNKAGISQNLNSRDSQKGIQMDIQFREDEEDDGNYMLSSQNKSENATRGEGQASLAELFKKKKADLAKKYELEQQQRAQRSETQEPKKERTKEEILKQRKEMMKRPDFLKNKNSTSQEESSINEHQSFQKSEQRGYMTSFHDPSKKIKEPPQELMDRLANGTKAKVDKKEYLKLTNKNYEMLPEVKKRKEEEQKREEYKRRQESVKKLQQNIRDSQKIKKN
ncbi:hypothetical protein ABPG72_012750 [Tetrahymena utriculariae]